MDEMLLVAIWLAWAKISVGALVIVQLSLSVCVSVLEKTETQGVFKS